MSAVDLQPVIIEMWTEYAIGIIILFTRIYARCVKVIGWRWQGDDYLAVAAVFFFTWEVLMCQIITQKGTITGMTDETALSLTPAEYQSHEDGAKWLFAAWYMYVSLIWSLKGIMLFFFARLTKSLPEERLVKWGSVLVGAAYIATLLAITLHCHPIYKLWQVYPYAGDDCTQNTSKYYALVTTNVSTDLVIMYIPIPLLWRLQTTIKRKVMFGMMFCAGGFIVICTLLRCIICLQMPERLDKGLTWSIRETLVGILCTNAPAIKALFPGWLGGSSVKPSGGASGGSNLVTIGGSGAIKLSSRNKKSKMGLDTAIIYENDSEERIICEDAKGMALSSNQSAQSQGYLQSGTVHTVQTSSHNYQTSNHQASSYQGSSYHGSEERQRSNDFGLHV